VHDRPASGIAARPATSVRRRFKRAGHGYLKGVEAARKPDALEVGLYHALFKICALSDLDGPERSLEWAQSLVDDEQLLAAFADNVREAVETHKPRRGPSSRFRSRETALNS
jgi:hypothetical protein